MIAERQDVLAGLAETLKVQAESARDLIADTRRVSLAAPADQTAGTVLVADLDEGATEYRIADHAHGQIATHLGIPQKLYDRLLGGHPDLLENLANGLLVREPSKRMLRTVGGTVRAFLSDAYRPRDNWDLLDKAVLPALAEYPGRVTFKQATLTETRMYLKVVLPDFERPITPAVGDIIRGGLIIQNSEVGNGALVVAPYTDRLVCLNGMVHTDYGQRQRHVGRRHNVGEGVEAWQAYSDTTLALDDAAFFSKVGDVVRSVLNESAFDAIVAGMRELAGIRVDGAPDRIVEVLANRHGFTDTEAGSMLANLIEGGDLTGWGYVNSITRTARDLTDADRQTELEALAGTLVTDRAWAGVAA